MQGREMVAGETSWFPKGRGPAHLQCLAIPVSASTETWTETVTHPGICTLKRSPDKVTVCESWEGRSYGGQDQNSACWRAPGVCSPSPSPRETSTQWKLVVPWCILQQTLIACPPGDKAPGTVWRAGQRPHPPRTHLLAGETKSPKNTILQTKGMITN